MKSNLKMRATLGYANPAEFAKGVELNPALSDLIAAGFKQCYGAVVFGDIQNAMITVTPDNFPDLTGFECFVNHIHVEDLLGDRALADKPAILRQGVALALAIQKSLRSMFPDQQFQVILAFSEDGCSVRFHLIRPTEEWLASDLDAYAGESILVLESRDNSEES